MSLKGFARRLSFKKSKQSKSSTSGLTAAQYAATSHSSGLDLRATDSGQPDVLNQPSTSLRASQSQPSLTPSVSTFAPRSSSPKASRHVAQSTPLSDWIYEDIILERRGRGLGFNLAGGIDRTNEGDGSIYVTKLIPGGVAEGDGRLKVNDAILSVNGTSFVGLTHREAVDALKATPNTVHLRVKRFRPTSDNVSTIELYRPQGKGLGFTVAGGVGSQEFEGDDGIFVTRITEGGVADQDGRLAIGDRLLAVNDVSMTYVSHEEAVDSLIGAKGRVRLLVAKTNIDPQHFANARSMVTPLATGLTTTTIENGLKTPTSLNGNNVTERPRQKTAQSNFNHLYPAEDQNAESSSIRMRSKPAGVQSPTPGMLPSPSGMLSPLLPPTQQQQQLQPPPAVSPSQQSASPLSPQALPELIPQVMTGSEIPSFIKEERQILIRKGLTAGLGFNIVGGVDQYGIFVSYIVPGGAADQNGQLRKGDQIISVNNVNLNEATHQEASAALKAVGETALIIAQYRPEEFKGLERKVRQQHHQKQQHQQQQQPVSDRQVTATDPVPQRRTLFIRALFDYDSSSDPGPVPGKRLVFQFGDILHVVNAGQNDDWWQARKVLPWSDISSSSGLIPSRKRVESRPLNRGTTFNSSSDGVGSALEPTRPNSAIRSRRRSFILSSKNPFGKSKEKLHTDGEESASTGFSSFWPTLSYETVVQVQAKMARPVVIFGPLKDKINDDLVADFPDKYSSCVPHTTRPIRRGEVDGRDYHFVLSREMMERDIRSGLFVEAGVYNDHLYGMSAEAIKHVAMQGKHCLLDVSTGAIPRLQAAGIHPIVILIKPRSPAIISNWSQPISEDAALKVHAATIKLFTDSCQHFTAVVTSDVPFDVYGEVKQAIEDHSQPLIWVTSTETLP